ncbi:DRB0094 family RNA ligase [Apiospora rasikravindrae]|uniref:DRB0094 family RNA ligase n=1 Tax=Apiospora rasikravindrae TaxID=990691 RepID=A0ABR1UBN2_9PEZI
MARRLVTVRKVTDIQPIKGADRIEIALVDGWQCIVKKDGFEKGQLGVFFEIDSFLPAEDPRWAFLEPNFINWNGHRGFRVKSQKMRGQISQGLLIPLGDFPEVTGMLKKLKDEHGQDEAEKLTQKSSFEDILKVQKWEAMDSKASGCSEIPKEPIPSFIHKTDQERCQNLPDVFEEWKDEIFQESTKMDGSSMTVYFVRNDSDKLQDLSEADAAKQPAVVQPNGRFGVCSRNVDIAEDNNNSDTGPQHWRVAKKNKLPEQLAGLNRNLAIQGELCGATVQGNFEGFAVGFHDFFVFAVWDIDVQKYLPPNETEAMAKQLGLRHVPVIGYFPLREIATSMSDLLQRAEGIGLNKRKREGIVLKHIGSDFSFKAISNSYLLKRGE